MKINPMLLAATMLVAPAHAYAQNTSQTDSEGLGDIVVTANRAETSAQDTPIALNVYSGDDLVASGIDSVNDLTRIDPSVNVTNSTGAAYVAIRGIASTDVTEIGDPSVPIARDGFYVNRSFSINSSMYDLARVEVLKGPQGTLNGRNSTGGLISIITNRPRFEDGGYASIDVGNYETRNGEMGANLALSDSLAVRASGVFLTHGGYRTLNGPGRYGDDEDFASGRVQALYRSGDFCLWLSYQHDSRDVNGDAQLTGTLGGPQPDLNAIPAAFPNSAPISTKLTSDRFRWEFSYDGLAGLNIVYAGGYDKSHWRNVVDATGPVYPAVRQFRQSETPRTWNHEFRISNDANSRLFFQAGYFRFEEDNTVDSGLYNREMTGAFAVGGPLAAMAQPNQFGIKFDYEIATRSQALFGQVDYEITDQLELTVGARYTWDDKSRTGTARLFLPALASPFAPALTIVNPGNGELSASEPTWHAGINYRPTDDNMVYFRYARGYKSGGFNSNGSAASIPYGAETLDSFELGTKNSLMGNTLQLNLTGFYFNYRGYQASQSSAAIGGGNGIFNVGSARIWGVEGEAVTMLTDTTRIRLNATVLNTKFGNNIQVRNGANVTVDISGNELPNAPGLTLTAGLEQDVRVGNGDLTARLDGKYSSSFYYSVFNTADTQSPSSFLANASLSYDPDNAPWSVQVYVRNIFDEDVLSYAARNFVANINGYQFQPPRTYGVRASVQF
ncbi:MAG: TonB-dependent receptor [Sphingopyxis sp.]